MNDNNDPKRRRFTLNSPEKEPADAEEESKYHALRILLLLERRLRAETKYQSNPHMKLLGTLIELSTSEVSQSLFFLVTIRRHINDMCIGTSRTSTQSPQKVGRYPRVQSICR
jgi:hypothetical protein